MEDIIAVERIFLNIVRAQLRRSTQIGSERTLSVRRHQDDRETGHSGLRKEQNRLNTIFEHILAVEIAHFVVSYLTDKRRFTAQRGNTVDGIGCRTTGYHAFADRKKTILDLFRLIFRNQIHTSFRKSKFAQIILADLQEDVC